MEMKLDDNRPLGTMVELCFTLMFDSNCMFGLEVLLSLH